ncbi:MAG: hypothetical protein K1X44_07440 [Alphaproteobacteria bacterium]|nr:hypothetical protein [Alphaproteobacteria bacterium]
MNSLLKSLLLSLVVIAFSASSSFAFYKDPNRGMGGGGSERAAPDRVSNAEGNDGKEGAGSNGLNYSTPFPPAAKASKDNCDIINKSCSAK